VVSGYGQTMPQPGDLITAFSPEPGRCFRLVYSRQLQATHCRQPPAWRWELGAVVLHRCHRREPVAHHHHHHEREPFLRRFLDVRGDPVLRLKYYANFRYFISTCGDYGLTFGWGSHRCRCPVECWPGHSTG
jgi:hypothetical protein